MINPKVIARISKNIIVMDDLKSKINSPIVLTEINSLKKEIDDLLERYPEVNKFIAYFDKKGSQDVSDEPEVPKPIVGSGFEKDGVEGLVEGLYARLQTYKKNGELSSTYRYVKIDD